MTVCNLRMVVCNTEETERDLGVLAQLLKKVLHTSETKKYKLTVTCQY